MIEPPGCITFAAAFATCHATPRMLRIASPTVSLSVDPAARDASSSSRVSGTVRNGCRGPADPALFTTMSRRPCLSIASAIATRTDRASAPSSVTTDAHSSVTPVAAIAATRAASTRVRSRPVSTTVAPSRRKCRTISPPRLPAAPVTSATLPVRRPARPAASSTSPVIVCVNVSSCGAVMMCDPARPTLPAVHPCRATPAPAGRDSRDSSRRHACSPTSPDARSAVRSTAPRWVA